MEVGQGSCETRSKPKDPVPGMSLSQLGLLMMASLIPAQITRCRTNQDDIVGKTPEDQSPSCPKRATEWKEKERTEIKPAKAMQREPGSWKAGCQQKRGAREADD